MAPPVNWPVPPTPVAPIPATPVAPVAPRQAGQFRVQVSANVILWPCICACCGARLQAPIGAVPAAGGVMAIKMQVNTFAPLYCQPCLEHMALHDQWARMAVNTNNGCGSGCVASPFVGLFALVACGTLTNSWSFAFIAGVLGAIAAIFTGSGYDKSQKQASQAMKDQAASRAQGAMTPQCLGTGPAAAIVNSYGSTRLFEFRDQEMADIFARLNHEKIVY